MLEEINTAIGIYQAKWQKMRSTRKDRAFFDRLKLTAVAWKVEDFTELQQCFGELRDKCDQIHWGWLNERWLITLRLRTDNMLDSGIELIKLMQRRPDSKDAIGLDHMDFLIPEGMDAKKVLAAEKDLKWTEEMNGEFCKWISIWFDGAEAKLRSDTTLDVCIAEMQAINGRIKKR